MGHGGDWNRIDRISGDLGDEGFAVDVGVLRSRPTLIGKAKVSLLTQDEMI